MKKRVFSGVKPSGNLHIGNYLGAIKNWVPMQDEYDCIFCVVDWHAITVHQEPELLRERTKNIIAFYLAAGLNPGKCILFIQSHLKEHAELAWLLNTITPVPELERMTQYKDYIQKQKGTVNAGLLNYPVLMAADILIYNTELVPVGQDQQQHVELARVIAKKFNNLYGETFKLPQALIRKEAAKIKSLTNPEKKMSKSDDDPLGCIDISDSPDTIREKIKKAVTDSGNEIKFGEDKPAISNLLTIYSLFSDQSIKDLEKKHAGQGYGEFKTEMAEAVVEGLRPFQEKYFEIQKDTDYLSKALAEGAQKARAIAEPMMEKVRERIGLK